MSPARRVALIISRSAFRFLLVTFVSLVAFYVTFGDARHIKRALSDSDAYSRFVPAIIESNNKQTDDTKPNLFADKNVQAIAIKAFSPDRLQREAEGFIDSLYVWLNGQTFQPEFTVDFTVSRQQLANDLSEYGIDRLRALPACGVKTELVELDPFTASCQPIGVNYDSEQLILRNELLNSKDFLPKVKYTAADLPKTNEGKTLPEAFAFAPFMFGMMWYVMWALLLVIMLLALAVVTLRTVHRQGWRQLGRMMAETGVFVAISGYVFGLVVPQFTRSFQSQFSGNGAEVIFNDVTQRLTVAFEAVLITASIVMALVGVGIMLLVRIMKPVSRYEGLEKVTGLVNGLRPKVRYAKGSRAKEAPIVSSERRNSTRNRQSNSQNKSKVKKGLGL